MHEKNQWEDSISKEKKLSKKAQDKEDKVKNLQVENQSFNDWKF